MTDKTGLDKVIAFATLHVDDIIFQDLPDKQSLAREQVLEWSLEVDSGERSAKRARTSAGGDISFEEIRIKRP